MSKPLDTALAAATLLALAVGGGWLMDGWIARQGWMAWNGQKWAAVATGWPLAVHAWPVALGAATALLAALWPILAWAARRRAESALAGRLADIERRGQALERGRQATERGRQDAQARLDALRQDLDAAHARELDELEDRMTDVQIRLEYALAEAREDARRARAEAADAKAQLDAAERGRKNAAWAAARMKSKIAQGVPGQGLGAERRNRKKPGQGGVQASPPESGPTPAGTGKPSK